MESQPGATETHGFVINMAWLFETLVARLLGEQDADWTSQQTMPLDDAGRLTIKPDLLLERALGISAVADTKYKLLDENGKIPNADAYQLMTYCARLGLAEGHLIYAGDDRAPDSFTLVGTGLQLHVHAVDLTGAVGVIETQIRDICERIASPTVDVRPAPEQAAMVGAGN